MLEIIFLGTGGAIPTPKKNTAAVMIKYGGNKILFDCGEGTQRQMAIAKTGINKGLNQIFISHFHGDHFIGLPGLIQTMNFNGRKEDLFVYGPRHTKKFLTTVKDMGYCKFNFDIIGYELRNGDRIEGDGYSITAFDTDHNVPSLGYIFQENKRAGRFNVDAAISLGLKPGPLYSKLISGKAVEVDGRIILPDMVIGPPRDGRKIVYSGDTRPCETLFNAVKNADVAILDGTFDSSLKDWADRTGHSTIKESIECGLKAGAKKIILIHTSPRYSANKEMLYSDIRKDMTNVIISEDFLRLNVPFCD
ncbi:MAG: ribonuclease Z [Candidatus Methanoliparum thermophilum]|uniref:Ribonuclease Z n=1 Tax=Methanoliparum thermophilum TaxID=2491083 RepID=A0A520KSD8_METT2|nr:ribonuclease Z [Candidatus Methanoliparum sp. LAM-1]RZN64826.1 MAG: ribonuclease Z [Candidatus Methanoliparum thermophilum]BDC36303.1 ribonuclease Z [Candidatus Methanoliparum sp. LAM-1]